MDRSKPRKAALRGSSQPALRSHPRKSGTAGPERERAGPPGHQAGHAPEAAILEKVERVAEALSSGKEGIDAKQAADFLSISESEFKRMAPRLPRHAVTERRYIYLRSELLAWLTRR